MAEGVDGVWFVATAACDLSDVFGAGGGGGVGFEPVIRDFIEIDIRDRTMVYESNRVSRYLTMRLQARETTSLA